MSPGRTYTFTMDPARMTLVMELRDGPTGQILGRVIDKRIGRDTATLQLTNRVINSAEFRRAVDSYAKRLRQALDRGTSRQDKSPALRAVSPGSRTEPWPGQQRSVRRISTVPLRLRRRC